MRTCSAKCLPSALAVLAFVTFGSPAVGAQEAGDVVVGVGAAFVAVGAGLSTDPAFMGDRFGPHAAVGAWLWPSEGWGLQGELRGRRLGKGNGMAELSVAVARRFLSS